jgi:hypothetical protein
LGAAGRGPLAGDVALQQQRSAALVPDAGGDRSSLSRRRAASATAAPWAARADALAAPIPPEAPVTSATVPSSTGFTRNSLPCPQRPSPLQHRRYRPQWPVPPARRTTAGNLTTPMPPFGARRARQDLATGGRTPARISKGTSAWRRPPGPGQSRRPDSAAGTGQRRSTASHRVTGEIRENARRPALWRCHMPSGWPLVGAPELAFCAPGGGRCHSAREARRAARRIQSAGGSGDSEAEDQAAGRIPATLLRGICFRNASRQRRYRHGGGRSASVALACSAIGGGAGTDRRAPHGSLATCAVSCAVRADGARVRACAVAPLGRVASG